MLPQEKEGITICATIHCPSIETFRLFDRVLLLQHGRAVYHGDNGAPVIDYFQTNFPDVRRQFRRACVQSASRSSKQAASAAANKQQACEEA